MDTSSIPHITSEELEECAKLLRAEGLDPTEVHSGQIRDICKVRPRRARSLKDWFRSGQIPQEGVPDLDPIEEHRLQRENRELRKQLEGALSKHVLNEDYEKFVADVASAPIVVPEWACPERETKHHRVIPTAPLADWHLDEVVKPEEIEWKNGYDRAIAKKRLSTYFENVIKVGFKYIQGFSYSGLCCPMLGDVFNANIHEELRRTNADVLLSSLLYWIGPMAAGLKMLADAYGKLYVPVVVGNHGRNTVKPIYKSRARDNFDWLFAQLLRRELSGDKRITWAISEGQKFPFNLYQWKFIISHGDEVKGGHGIAGILSPLILTQARMRKNFDFDYWLLGHWHHQCSYQNILCSGSGVGWSEYSAIRNLNWQEPQQQFFLTDPKHGVIGNWPVFFMSENEPWLKNSPIKKRRSATVTSAFSVGA